MLDDSLATFQTRSLGFLSNTTTLAVDTADGHQPLSVHEPGHPHCVESWIDTSVPFPLKNSLDEIYACFDMMEDLESQCSQGRHRARAVRNHTPAPKLCIEWRGLRCLHQRLLDTYYEFLRVLQHPAVPQVLQQNTLGLEIAEDIWQKCISAFIETANLDGPTSPEHLLAFLPTAFSFLTVLHDEFPALRHVWTKHLAALAFQGLLVTQPPLDNSHPDDPDTWTLASRHWLSKAAELNPSNGCIYHDLAHVENQNGLKRLLYLTKSACVAEPESWGLVCESFMVFFMQVACERRFHGEPRDIERWFVQVYLMLFVLSHISGHENLSCHPSCRASRDKYHGLKARFKWRLAAHITRFSENWTEKAGLMAIVNSNAMLEFGKEHGIAQRPESIPLGMSPTSQQPDMLVSQTRSNMFEETAKFVHECDRLIIGQLNFDIQHDIGETNAYRRLLDRGNESNVLAYLYIRLAFMLAMVHPGLATDLASKFPWTELSDLLNSLLERHPEMPQKLPQSALQPLPED